MGDDCGVSPCLSAALQIRISHPEALPELMDALAERVDFVVNAVLPDRAGVSVLGSFADGGEAELAMFLRGWKATHPGVEAEVEPDDPQAPTVLPLPESTRSEPRRRASRIRPVR